MASLSSNSTLAPKTGPGAAAPPDAAVVQVQVKRILESALFRECPMQQKLLRYIVDETLAGAGRDLKEYSLGVAVFARGDEFDPRRDSIVRVQVGVLRKKLAAFYAEAAPEDEVWIDIPRGHYSAEFHSRNGATEEQAAQGETMADSGWRRWPWREAGLLLGGIVLASVFWFAWSLRTPASGGVPSSAFEWRQHPIWRGFFDAESSTQLVIGSPFMMRIGGLYIRDSEVNSLEDIKASERIHKLEQAVGGPVVADELYTGLGEAAATYTLGRFFAVGEKPLPLVRSRLARWQDIAHSNLLILSSARFRTPSQELSLPRDFVFDSHSGAILNRHPRSGEAASYPPRMSGGNAGEDYAVISVWPSPQPGRRIMTISGTYTWGTQGGGEFVTDGPNLRKLQAQLVADEPRGQEQGLQILVKVLVKDGQPVATSYVTHHWLKAEGESAAQ